MQPLSPEAYTSVARRPLDIEDYFDIIRRHKAWIFAPVFATLVVAVVVAFLWPDSYVSTATIRVAPAQVPESYVPTNVNVQMSQRINSMYQAIESSTSLTNIINLHNLYVKERQRKPMLDVVEQMKKDINLGPVRSLAQGSHGEITAFTLSFRYQNRIIAQKVTAELVSRFMSENQRERAQSSMQTTQFLKDQWENAKKELDAIDAKVASFRQTFQGRLPEEIAQNQMHLNSLENRIANLNAGLSRINQEKLLLESDLRSQKTRSASLLPAPDQVVTSQRNSRLDQLDKEIFQLETALTSLRERFKERHPDLASVTTRLNTAKTMRERVAKEEDQQQRASASPSTPAPTRRVDPAYEREAQNIDATINRIETELKAKDIEADTVRKSIQAATNQINIIQSRIQAAPLSQQQYAEVIRDREVAKAKYDSLNKMRQQSSIAEELERRQQGETLELLEQASLPMSPTSPDRPMIIAAGTAMGLVLGLVLAGAREAKDTSLKNLKDVRAYGQLAILGSIPLLENDLVVRRRRRLGWLAWSTAFLVGILIMAGAVFYYFATKI